MTPKLTFRLLDAPPSVSADVVTVVQEAWLPLLLWPDVPVLREVRRELTPVERFLLESSLALQTFSAEDIEEITSIPRLAVHRIARRLSLQRALAVRPDKTYGVQPVEAQTILDRQAIVEEKEDTLTFLFLPRTGELLAFDDDGPEPPKLDRLRPPRRAPVPVKYQHEKKHGFLQAQVRDRVVAGLPGDVVDVLVPEDDSKIPETCPAFHCRGVVEQREGLHLFLELYDDKEDIQPVAFNFTGAEKLVESWVTLSNALKDEQHFRRAWRTVIAPKTVLTDSMRAESDGARWQVRINETAAQGIAQAARLLVAPIGLGIESEESIVAVEVQLQPSEPPAARLFAIDTAIVRLAAVDAPHAEAMQQILEEVRGQYQLDKSGILDAGCVLDRLWQLKHYGQVYALRSQEDFNYD